MKSEIKYAGIDLHQSTCVMEIQDESGRAMCQTIIKMEAKALRDFFSGLSGPNPCCV
jgi:hypothetical protein